MFLGAIRLCRITGNAPRALRLMLIMRFGIGCLASFVALSLPLTLALNPLPRSRRGVLKRFKTTAAPAVHGVSHLDLLRLPETWALRLLDPFQMVEAGALAWPDAVLYGVVNVLAKDVGASTVDRFRPVLIFSVLYRAGSRLRPRQLLRLLARHMDVEAFRFLAGSLSFVDNRGLVAQIVGQLLSAFPCLKLSVLPSVFWSSALYGVNGSRMGEEHLDRLRSQAMRALRLDGAGVNGLLRLSLSTTPAAGPGFWRLRRAVLSFVRLLRKELRLLVEWTRFMQHFAGKLLSGPFSQLLVVLGPVAWRSESPCLIDHDGFSFDLLRADPAVLEKLLGDGWLQHVARIAARRQSVDDLAGLSPQVLCFEVGSLTALDRARLDALQPRTFVSAANHRKYDRAETGLCSVCCVLDTTAHWRICPRFQSIRGQIAGWAIVQHVFADGSATDSRKPYRLAAWGAVCATSGEIISAGHVPGLNQSIDRAELLAILSALEWRSLRAVDMRVWIDSQFACNGVLRLQEHGEAGDWSHRDVERRTDWVKIRNDRADVLACRQTKTDLASLNCFQALAHFDSRITRMRQLRPFYSRLAAQEKPDSEGTAVSHFDFDVAQFCVDALYISDVSTWVNVPSGPSPLPFRFVCDLVGFLIDRADPAGDVYPCCYEELVLWLAKDFDFQLLFTNPAALGSLVYYVRTALVWFYSLNDLGGGDVLFDRQNKVSLGIHRPAGGVYVRLAAADAQRCSGLMANFTASRPIRKACDVARPIPV
eukprot:Skav219032  [mRNA]  locus=scaffold511:61762:64845:+ [translate_table: standard]